MTSATGWATVRQENLLLHLGYSKQVWTVANVWRMSSEITMKSWGEKKLESHLKKIYCLGWWKLNLKLRSVFFFTYELACWEKMIFFWNITLSLRSDRVSYLGPQWKMICAEKDFQIEATMLGFKEKIRWNCFYYLKASNPKFKSPGF